MAIDAIDKASIAACAGLVVCGGFFGVSPLAAYQGPTSGAAAFSNEAALAQPDSSHLLDLAHDAQRRFERVRRRHLPWSWGGYGGECDERVGRMCWHHDDPEDDWTKPEEPDELVRAREELVDTLAALSRTIPGDRWVLGQLVWYLGEGGRWDRAASLTGECPGGDEPWCAALRGLALHKVGDYPEAARAFAAAGDVLDAMGGDAARDFRVVLDDAAREVLADVEAPSGIGADSLFWLLADPMYVVPGNDRRTEHEARRVVNRIRTGARNPYRMPWGKDMTELVMRFGWAESWERVRGYSGTTEPLSILGRHRSKGRRYLPSGPVLKDPTAASAAELAPTARRPRTTYTPDYSTVIRPAAAEVFEFDRGDSTLVIGAFVDNAVRRSLEDSVPDLQAAFALDLETGIKTRGHATSVRAWELLVPRRAHLISLEHLPEDGGEARRHRQSIVSAPRDRGVAALSELMLLEGSVEPASPSEAAGFLRSAVVAPGETVTIAWEAYGLGFEDTGLAYDLRVARNDGGLLATVGGWVGLGGDDEGLLIDWTEAQPDDPGPQFRSVSLTFPPLEEGEYTLSLALRLAGRSAVVRERVLVVSTAR